jgi:hypothetical protein
MPGYTIDININAGGSGSGQAASSQGASARPTTITDEQRREQYRKGIRRLNIAHSSSFISAKHTADLYEGKGEVERQKAQEFGKAALAGYAATQVVEIGWNAVKTFKLDNIGEKYGDQARQNQVNNALNIAGRAKSVAGSAASGALAGAAAGPVGAIVGAAIGIISNVANQSIQATEAQAKWLRKEQENLYASIRSSERLGVDISQRSRSR